VTLFANKTRSHGNDLSNESTHNNRGTVGNGVFFLLGSMQRSDKWDEVKTEFSWKRVAIRRGLEPESRGLATVRRRY
jgi:hypothetical protein